MTHGMEPEVKKYLGKILYTIFFGLLWMSLNVLGGFYWGYAVIKGQISLANVVFFLWFILSLTALLYYYYKTWGK